jgi:hypothetical protein
MVRESIASARRRTLPQVSKMSKNAVRAVRLYLVLDFQGDTAGTKAWERTKER